MLPICADIDAADVFAMMLPLRRHFHAATAAAAAAVRR